MSRPLDLPTEFFDERGRPRDPAVEFYDSPPAVEPSIWTRSGLPEPIRPTVARQFLSVETVTMSRDEFFNVVAKLNRTSPLNAIRLIRSVFSASDNSCATLYEAKAILDAIMVTRA